MSEFDLEPLQSAIEKYIPLGRSGLLPALHAAQQLYGWLPESVSIAIARSLRIPLADIHGVIEFYSMFTNKPSGKSTIHVCTGLACSLKRADDILAHFRDFRLQYDTPDRGFSGPVPVRRIETSPCLGLCELAPAALVDDQAETLIELDKDQYALGRPISIVYGTVRMLTSNCGNGTTLLAQYGGYSGLQKALTMRPEQVVQEVKASGLVGRGGAAFPTGIKWEGAAQAISKQKYVICNADESEPGTFKDRILLLDDPHRVIEGMCIAAYAIRAGNGIIFLRGEYAYILPVLEQAIEESRAAGYLGGGALDFDIEIRLGAGAYICGEETALFESIEGKRGFPRVKPPFPTTHGLFNLPTVINNVETLCNVPLILRDGALEYRRLGTEKSPGSKLFCLSGDITKPGLYEIPFGLALGELFEMAGGVSNGGSLKAILLGGAAGAFADSSSLHVPLTFEDLRSAGLPLGSGVVMVFDESRDLRKVVAGLGEFFAHESCGKCYPCQMGTQRQKEILNRLATGNPYPADIARLQDIGWTMTDSSLCGLGQTAASAVLSAINLWPGLFGLTEQNGYEPRQPGTDSVRAQKGKTKKPSKSAKTSRRPNRSKRAG
ncbi:MAG: NADH-quinone oxidoreductase subunit E [Chloroflexi bacterium]|nr:NADH-quinone oxidoreductase subunit E [Chloroflexota bacterium]